ncbi:MAG TPA: prolipoprotein diacylglyceryl transferase [Nocardioidaceae bacterium]|nr:prolipoprotein diacylglyceryl transferase [Nocardioidaceae bacterium]
MILEYIPSPGDSVWEIGPVPIRAYALCIIAGVLVAVWLGEKRWVARGGRPGQVGDMAVWAVPFGIVGGRLYHVITDNERYFGEGQRPITALYVWEGGLGIWGAIALGALGAYLYARRQGLRMPPMMDALAPCLLLAQAIGRWGNWFNQELFGKPLDTFWALEIDERYRPEGYGDYATFHPTYLYEFLWNLGGAGLVIWADRRFKLGRGRVFALYVMVYCAGRGWIEYLRIDPVQADDVLGLRLNVWTSIVLFVLALAYFVVVGRRRPGREESVWREGREPAAEDQGARAADAPELVSRAADTETPATDPPPEA